MKKDLFISHASEDKDDFVRPLANLLIQYGLDVWYDEFELRIGRSISRTIDKGISNSNFGLLVLSHSFFAKNWTEYELKSLNSYEIENSDVLLPIWKAVNQNEVREFSPYLADKFALTTEDLNIEQIALKIIETVNPDLFSEIHKKIAVEESLKNSETSKIPIKDIKPSPIKHPKLNENQISRIRLIRSSLWLCNPHSMEFWMDGFKRDLNIEREIRFWEHLGTCFLELITHHDVRKYHLGNHEEVFKDTFQLLFKLNNSSENLDEKDNFKNEFVEIAKETFFTSLPVYDIQEDSPFEKNEE